MMDETLPRPTRPDELPPVDAATLVPSEPTAAGLATPAAEHNTLARLPTDATLNATDPESQAIQQAALAAAPQPTPTGTAFGHYDLLEPIAKGGMGIVYRARQRKLNRIVAIKMILDGQFADQADIDRFYAEAEAAAALSHPNIVAIHEIGHAEGQHYFSMDFIEGQSLAALVRENPLAPRRAAEFVVTIAEAVQFAHDHGVVHRDLKPANILLDKRLRPLITDFGLAKQVNSQSQRTLAGAVVGTPSYMPPEQAAGRVDEIGPWSDQYSLGAILYELLIGRPPFRSASPFETIRQVLDTEPVSPRLINPQVPRDLETICLKCLQKERTRRYGSVQELADELGRYLRGEPIHARPIGQLARLWRLCKRNPITSAAIALAAVFFVAASLISTIAYVRTSAALHRESAALAQSEQSLHDAMAAVDDLFTRVSEDKLLNRPGMQGLRKELLDKAKDYYERFLAQRADDPRVQDGVARSHFRLGRIAFLLGSPGDAQEPFNTARAIQDRLLADRPADAERLSALGDTLNALGEVAVEKKDYATALQDYDEAARIRLRLVGKDAHNAEYQRVLANTYMNAGVAAFMSGDKEAARLQYEEAQRVREAALAREPDNAKLRRDLAKGYYSLARIDQIVERFAEAESYFTRAVQALESLVAEFPDDLDNQKLLGICDRLLGDQVGGLDGNERLPERRTWYERALARLEPLAQQNPDVVEYQNEWAAVLLNLYDAQSRAGDASAALASLSRARDIYERLVRRYPDTPRPQRDLAVTLRELGLAKSDLGQQAAAAADIQESIRYLGELAQRYPADADFAEQLAVSQAALTQTQPARQ